MKNRTRLLSILCFCPLLCTLAFQAGEPKPSLQQQLRQEAPQLLAQAARQQGDAARGALIFYRPELGCTRCHGAGEEKDRLGPDLGQLGKEATDLHLVESLLWPSKVIKQGYATVVVATEKGLLITGLLEENRSDALIVRDPAAIGKLLTIPKSEIEQWHDRGPSLMPEGLVNQLSDRQEFLDLTRYLMELAAKGPDYARQMRPAASLFAPPPLPAYEQDLDHAGLLRDLDARSFVRGKAIYQRVCANCHGTQDQPGSMPTSPRFVDGKLKNGADPLRMYRTLTEGYAMMTPQYWMVPEQKYDVIHYIREAFFKPHNPTQYVAVDEAYLSGLPTGKSRGPKPSTLEPWVAMDYGPTLQATLEIGNQGHFAYKGIAIRLDQGPGGVSRGRHWMLFDHDTMRMAACWSGEGFIDWKGINFNGQHQVHPRVIGQVQFVNAMGPGWANPDTGSLEDPRPRGRDGKPYGPLPREWARYKGLYHFGHQAILEYTVGDCQILEMPAFELTAEGEIIYTRHLDLGRSSRDLLLRVASKGTAVALVSGKATLKELDQDILVHIPASETPLVLKVLLGQGKVDALQAFARSAAPPASLKPFIKGGPRRWPEVLKTQPIIGGDAEAFAIDVLTHPAQNPWQSQMRMSGLDFFHDARRAAVCTWDGDVWLVAGIDQPEMGLTWQRIATGLFQPLGLKIVDDAVYVCCRDQIVKLVDLNVDGETDFYECFNNDHQVTEHFHEFAMGLQTDEEGHFYYAKAARHALQALVPHHGTLLQVSKDGSKTAILATGFRAPNGICLNPDGTFFLTDQEGFWVPKNRIDRVERGGYYGNFWGYHDVTDASDAAMKQPVCWITNAFDRSPSEMLWVPKNAWGPLQGSLLNFSYGYGKIYVVPHEKVGDQWQGGMCALPLPRLPTGVMRGRFHPQSGQLYCCGMFAWAGDQVQPGGLYRVRYTGKPIHLPIGLQAKKNGMVITFSGALDAASVAELNNFSVKTWSLRRSARYGSEHIDEQSAKVTSATLEPDLKKVTLHMAGMKPTMGMEMKYTLKTADGKPVSGIIHGTSHQLGD